MREKLISYFNQVLGIREIFLPATPPPRELPAEKNPRAIKVLFIDENPWTPAVAALFVKIREAMKITPDQCEVVFGTQISRADLHLKSLSARAVVSFSDRYFAELPSENKFITLSPTRLLQEPSLKRAVWDSLQVVMRSLHKPMG